MLEARKLAENLDNELTTYLTFEYLNLLGGEVVVHQTSDAQESLRCKGQTTDRNGDSQKWEQQFFWHNHMNPKLGHSSS